MAKAESEKHSIHFGTLHPVPCAQHFSSHSKQATSPTCVRFLFQVQGETAGVGPAFMSIGNRMQMNVVSAWDENSHKVRAKEWWGVPRGWTFRLTDWLLRVKENDGWGLIMDGPCIFHISWLGFPNCKALGDNFNSLSLWGVLIVKLYIIML